MEAPFAFTLLNIPFILLVFKQQHARSLSFFAHWL